MIKISAGILMYNFDNIGIKVFLVHPGGPFWKNKDSGAWSIPKGEPNDNENLLVAAKREFFEETGIKLPIDNNSYIDLSKITQKSGKIVYCWAFKEDFKGKINCTSFVDVEWPPKSGKFIKIPEIDKGEFFLSNIAKKKINPAQIDLIDRLINKLNLKEKTKQVGLDVFK